MSTHDTRDTSPTRVHVDDGRLEVAPAATRAAAATATDVISDFRSPYRDDLPRATSAIAQADSVRPRS